MEFVSNKFKLALYTILIVIIVYFIFSYMVPLVLPFIVAYGLSYLIRPMLKYIKHRFRIEHSAIVITILTMILAIVLISAGFIGRELFIQIEKLICNMDTITEMLYNKVEIICGWFANNLDIEHDYIMLIVEEYLVQLGQISKDIVLEGLMGKSIPIIKGVVEIIVGVIIIWITAFLFTKERESIDKWRQDSVYKNELNLIFGKVKAVLLAFIKTQVIVWIIVSIICISSLWLMRNEYSVILGIIIGTLDALPFIGTGVILIPWAIANFLSGNVFRAICLISLFIITYVIREILEPKLMGENLGLSPLMTLVTIYVGYRIFGILGLLYGPIAFVIIKTILENAPIASTVNSEEKV